MEKLRRPIDINNLWLRYSTALVSTALAFWGRAALHPWLKEECPFSLFYLSVLLTAWLAGSGPAILAIILGTASAAFVFIEPRLSLRVDTLSEFVQLSIYVGVNIVAACLFDRLERQRVVAEQRAQENARLSESLRQTDERKDEYLALLAHELRNPLAPIRSGLVMLEREPDSPETVHRVLNVLERQTTHLVRLTQDLLDISRISNGRIVLQTEVLNLTDAIRDGIEMVSEQIEERGHRFQLLLPREAIVVQGDRVRLAQVVANLIGNAVKYTPSGGTIIVELERTNEDAHISVTDNGVGFAPDQAERIFEMFTQVDPSRTREHGGLGLGLSIVKTLVELHGGVVIARSRGPGLGSEFRIRIPLLHEATTGHPLAVEPATGSIADPPSNDTAPRSEQARILLVEDNLDAALLLSTLLTDDGYDVSIASDGIEAIRQASSVVPEFCLHDIGLPGIDGYEVARRIRRMPEGADIKLIALTGWGTQLDQERSSSAGFDLHLVKPVAYKDLINFLNKVNDTKNDSSRISRGVDHQLSV